MKRRGGAVFYSVLVLGLATAASEACGQAAAPVGAGGTCTLTTDCAEGYACLPQADGSRECSNNFSSIQSTEDAGLDATTAVPGEAAPQDDAMASSGEGGTPPQDSGPPAADTGSPVADTSTPPRDTGSPPEDTGSPPLDTGAPPDDTGAE